MKPRLRYSSGVRLFFFCGFLLATAVAQTAVPPTNVEAQRKAIAAGNVPYFQDIASQAGLTVSHISSPSARYIVESVSGGVGLIDCDNDGRLDIVTVNGSNVDRYRQDGDLLVTLYQAGWTHA
jgi:hypothetical protein